MSEKKYIPPEGMLKAAWQAIAEKKKELLAAGIDANIAELHVARISVEAVLRWIAEHPIVPTEEQVTGMENLHRNDCSLWNRFGSASNHAYYCWQWQRRMFLAPEPEHKDGTVLWKAGTTIPIGVWANGKLYPTSENNESEALKSVKDLLWANMNGAESHNADLIEAYHRGYNDGYERSRETFG